MSDTAAATARETAGESAKRRNTRERLMDAAFRVFAENGLHAASVEQVTEAAGFTRGAFYSNFSSKEELFIALLERKHEQEIEATRAHIDEALANQIPVELDIKSLGTLIVDILRTEGADRDWQLLQLEAMQLALRDSSFAARHAEARCRASETLSKLVAAAVERIGRRLLIREDQAIRVLLAVYDGFLTDVLLEGAPISELAERAREPMAAVLLGITSRKG